MLSDAIVGVPVIHPVVESPTKPKGKSINWYSNEIKNQKNHVILDIESRLCK